MSVNEVKTGMPSSVEHGGTYGTVVPVGPASSRGSSPKQGTVRGNSTNKELELYMGNTWITYEPKVGLEPTASVSFTAKSPSLYPVDTTQNEITVTLPKNAKVGSTVTLVDSRGSWASNNLVVIAEESKVEGRTEPVVLSVNHTKITFLYLGIDGWIHDLPSSGLPSNEINDDDWPLTLRGNQSYFFALDSDNENEVTLPVAEIGTKIKLVVINELTFHNVPLTVKTVGAIKVDDKDQLNLNLDTSEIEFEFRGNQGWVITNSGERFYVTHGRELTSGSFNTMVSEGIHDLNGAVSGFSMLPSALSSEPRLIGSLDVKWNSGTCIQELTVVTGVSQANTRKFLRSGVVSGLNVTFVSSWIELSGIADNSRRVIVDPSDLVQDLIQGWYYIVNPSEGTPDHSDGDVYFVEVSSSGYANLKSQVNYSTRSFRVFNVNRQQWWESSSLSLTTHTGWRKVNANHVIEVNDGDDVTYRPLASTTNIWVNSEGNQSILLDCPATVGSLGPVKLGDIVVIHNLRKNVKETVVSSTVDLIDTENNNLGKGPHTMTGKGTLKLLVEQNYTGEIFFKILFGTKL